MKILVIGSGGREHAFCRKLKDSKTLSQLFIAPGNAGTAMLGENVSIQINDFELLKKFCLTKQ
ncbi:MAG: phosphoribosylamine--glycine ligase N-terminal domain-containing protein, partial [Ginsengibacter sp.]